MKQLVIAAGVISLLTVPALADEPVSENEGARIQAALEQWGCRGGEMEKERVDPVHYEIDDAICSAGEYDFRLDSEFNVIMISRH